jgi:prepilin peptidase CpaA
MWNDHLIALLLVLAAAAIAAYTDLRTRRIPNALSAALLVGGLSLSVAGGWQHAAVSIALFAAVLLAGTLLFSLKMIGGGDVKLLAAGAAALGWPDAAMFVLYTILAGGLLGIAITLARGQLRPMLANLRTMIFPVFTGLRPAATPSVVGSMPYGLAIFAGAATLAVTYFLGLSWGIFS